MPRTVNRLQVPSAQPRAARWLPVAAVVGTVIIAAALYLRTMPPTITWWFGGADSGDLASAADALGVPHPTGYPLFVLLGHLATRVPAGEVGGRINAMNALIAALGAGGLALTVQALAGARWRAAAMAMLAALAIATSRLYWSQAIIGEVYALHAALAVLVLWLWARPSTGPALLGAAHGLALTNHLTSIVLLGAALLVFGRARLLCDRGRPALWFVAGLAAALSLYALLPLRAAQEPLANWGHPDTAGRFLAHVTGREYGYLLGWHSVAAAPRDTLALLRLMVGDLPPWVLPAAALGCVHLLRVRREYVLFTALSGAGTLLFTAAYRSADRAPYLLPVYVVAGVWSGVGLLAAIDGARQWAPNVARRRWTIAAGASGLLVLTAVWAARAGARLDLHGDDSAVVFARATLAALPSGATFYTARDDVTFALWYAQRSLGIRRDVQVVDVRNPQLVGVPLSRRGSASYISAALPLWPRAVVAQGPAPAAGTARARASAGRDTTLALANVRLVVPAAAVAPGAIVALGVGGVPALEEAAGTTGIVVTAAGGLREPVAAVVGLSTTDRAATAGRTPALIDMATGARQPCRADGIRAACLVLRPGAYVVGGTSEPPAGAPLLRQALAAP